MARRIGIAKEDVVAAACAVADEAGTLDAVSLASVAERLGIRPPSLYAHVDGLDGLRRLLAVDAAAAMAEALAAAAEGRKAGAALESIATAYRRFALAHPGRYAAIQRAVRPGEDDALYAALGEVVRPVLRALEEAEVPPDDRIHLARAFRSALHGFVSLEVGGGFGRPEPLERSFERLVALLVDAAAGG